MRLDNMVEQRILEKLRQLPPEHVLQVEGFVNCLFQQNVDRSLTLAATKLAEPVLQKIWDNPDDAEYDQL